MTNTSTDIASLADRLEAAEIAKGLSAREAAFLCRVCDGEKPGYADREEDRARQSLRKMDLVAYVGTPKHWQPTWFGEQVRAWLPAE